MYRNFQEESSGGQAEELGLANVGGVFLVLVVGVAISFILTIFEFIFDTVMSDRNDVCMNRKTYWKLHKNYSNKKIWFVSAWSLE